MTRHIPTINAVDADSIQDYSYVQAEMDETFGQALARYMNELKIDIASLSASTGISKASIYITQRINAGSVSIILLLFVLHCVYTHSEADICFHWHIINFLHNAREI